LRIKIRKLVREFVKETLRTLCSALKEDMTRDRRRKVRFSGKGAEKSSWGKSLEDARKLRSATCARGEKGWRGGWRTISLKEVVSWMAGIQKHREEESAPRLRRYFNSLSSHSSHARYFGTPVWRCNIFHSNNGNNK